MGDGGVIGIDSPNVTVEDAPFPLTDTDKYVLSLTDEEYQYHSWPELKEIIGKSIFYHIKKLQRPVANPMQRPITSQSLRGSRPT